MSGDDFAADAHRRRPEAGQGEAVFRWMMEGRRDLPLALGTSVAEAVRDRGSNETNERER